MLADEIRNTGWKTFSDRIEDETVRYKISVYGKRKWIGSNRLDYKPFIQREYSALIRMQLIIRTCILKILCQSAGRFIPVHPFISADKTFHQSFLTGFLVFNTGTGQESTTFLTIKRSIRMQFFDPIFIM